MVRKHSHSLATTPRPAYPMTPPTKKFLGLLLVGIVIALWLMAMAASIQSPCAEIDPDMLLMDRL